MKKILACFTLLTLAVPARADWYEAETDHFVVRSEGKEEEATRLAVDLERFDQAMRYMSGIPWDTEPAPVSTKLTVYRFGDTDDIGRLSGSRGVAGFYVPRAGSSVAFVPAREVRERGSYGTRVGSNDLDSGVVLFHEYAHYFMYQNAPVAYPLWYSEGYAEVYGTLALTGDGFVIGKPATHRAGVLKYLNSYHVRELLDPFEYGERVNYEDYIQSYALGWLLQHYMTFSDERQGQLADYINRLNRGEGSLEAAEAAFGDLNELNRDLDRYRRGRTPVSGITYTDYTPPVARVRKMTEAEEAMMPTHIRSTRGVDEEEAQRLVPDARRLLERYPDSVPVMLTALEAEFDAENNDAASAIARRVLEHDPDNARAHLYLGHIALRLAEDDPAQFENARAEYASSNRLDPSNAASLHGYYRAYQLAGQAPPEQALIALEQSYDLAPFDSSIRESLAYVLLTEDRDREAVMLLGPIINDPHGGKRAKTLRKLADKIESGDKAEALAELAPDFDDADEEGEEELVSVSIGAHAG